MIVDRTIRWAFPAITLMAVLIEVITGPLLLDIVEYHMSTGATVQYMGGELITLAAAAILLASVFYERNSCVTLVGVGAGLYILYTMVSVIFGQDYHRYDGNAEQWFLLFVLITLTTIPVVARKLSLLLHAPTPDVGWAPRTTLIVFALAFTMMWLSSILNEAHGHSAEYLADPTLFWLIKYLDLAVVIPTGLICAAQWTGAYRVGGLVVLSFSFWILLAIAGMQISMTVATLSPSGALIVVVIMLVADVWAGWCLWRGTSRWALAGAPETPRMPTP